MDRYSHSTVGYSDFPAFSRILLRQQNYHRTVIVTAAVHRGFDCRPFARPKSSEQPTHLTFRHWAGFSPYTSSFEFAQTCVFDKQSIRSLYLRPLSCDRGWAYPEVTPSLFAEFLEESSLAHLSLLDSSTSVGSRYGLI